MFGSIGNVQGATTTVQNFEYSWTVGVWDYYGYVAAIQWQYQPYVASTETLTSVELIMDIDVTNLSLGDTFSYRSAFFTGWDPNAYQFYAGDRFDNVLSNTMSINTDYLWTEPSDLVRWTNPQYGPSGHTYFESTSFSNPHTVNVSSQLIYNYERTPVPEPSTMLLLGVGLTGLALWRKRKSVK